MRESESRERRDAHTVSSCFPSAFLVLGVLSLCCLGCGVKRAVRVEVPARILMAKTASFGDLVALVNGNAERIRSISSTTMRVTFRSGKPESGKLEEYHSAPGYILLQRPDSIRLSVQNPVTKTSIVDLVSTGDDFTLWVPRDNKFYTGKNSTREFGVERESGAPKFTARPIHILEAILPPRLPLGEPGYRIAMEEAQDALTKYYVLSLYREGADGRLFPVRKFWVDRADLSIARQQTYGGQGELESTVNYADLTAVDGVRLPLSIRIERPLDGYSLDLEFKDWRLNPEFPGNAFVLTPPPGAQRIRLEERGKDKES